MSVGGGGEIHSTPCGGNSRIVSIPTAFTIVDTVVDVSGTVYVDGDASMTNMIMVASSVILAVVHEDELREWQRSKEREDVK